MISVTARSSFAIAFIVLASLAVADPAFGRCGIRKLHYRAPIPSCGNQQIWDTKYQRCISFRADGPPDQKPWQLGPRWAPGTRDYSPAMSDWNN